MARLHVNDFAPQKRASDEDFARVVLIAEVGRRASLAESPMAYIQRRIREITSVDAPRPAAIVFNRQSYNEYCDAIGVLVRGDKNQHRQYLTSVRDQLGIKHTNI